MLDMKDENLSTSIYKPLYAKRKMQRGIFLVITAILAIALCAEMQIHMLERLYNELQNQLTQEVRLETGTYVGDTDFGIFTGEGIFTFESGEFYTGAWQNNQMEGNGQLSYPDIGQYVGEFSSSRRCGTGTFTWENGHVYSGHCKDDAMNGEGTYTFSDGSKMEGSFQHNQFYSGEHDFSNDTGAYIVQYDSGKMVSAVIKFADGTSYTGEFSHGQLNGSGQITYATGDTYQGSYQNGQRSGTGTYTWKTGASYAGNWDGDKMNGTGTYTYSSGDKLNGTFSENQFISGSYQTTTQSGEYTFTITDHIPVAVEMTLQNGLKYSGEISNGKLNGKGKLTYPSGGTYEGSFVNGLRDGEGVYEWTDGASYSGDWSADQMNGDGVYYYPTNGTGYKLSGSFLKGKPDGTCTYYPTSSTSYETTWKNGKCTKVTE